MSVTVHAQRRVPGPRSRVPSDNRPVEVGTVKQWVVVALAIVLGAQAPSYRAEIERARAARLAELVADDGWLTVTGLLWLKPGRNVAGSAARAHATAGSVG